MFAKICAAALVLVTLAACGTDSPPPFTTSAVPLGPAVPVTSSVPDGLLDLPFDDYRLNFAEESEVQRARLVLARACLRERGMRFEVPDDVRTPGALDVEPNLRRYGVVDEGSAGRYGYHVPTTDLERRQQADRARWSASLTEEQRAALFGEGGCASAADARLTTFADGFFVSASQRLLRSSERDPLVVSAVGRWRACMAAAGYSYSDPDAAISDSRWDLDSVVVSAAEVETAVADVRCKGSSGYVVAWHGVEVGLQREEIARSADRFAALRGALDRRVAAARRVLAG